MKVFLATLLALSAVAVPSIATMPQCDNEVKNPFTDVCGCNEQIYVQNDCRDAFWCTDSNTNTGCSLSCGEDQIVQFDYATGKMKCEDTANQPDYRCPGNFKLNCADDDVGSGFDPDNDCDFCPNGGFVMSSDCSEAMTCITLLFPTPGRTLKCDPGYKVAIDFYSLEWECVPDDGQCPGLGGFRLGCPEEIPENPEPSEQVNPYGTCECDGQFFSNEDCTAGIFCDSALGENKGMWTQCGEDQIIRPNFEFNTVVCINRVEGQQCPGAFNVECSDFELNPADCECDGQVWITNGCTEGFSCNSRSAGGGRSLSCFDGEVLNIDITAYSWDCVQDTSHCPSTGGFVLGACDGSWDGTPEESTLAPEENGNGASERVLSGALLAAALVLNAF